MHFWLSDSGDLKIFFTRIIRPIWTKLDTKHPWVKRIQVCLNEGSHPFPRGDNNEINTKLLTKFKIILLYNQHGKFEPNSVQSILGWRGLLFFTWYRAFLVEGDSRFLLGTEHSWLKGTLIFKTKNHLILKRWGM